MSFELTISFVALVASIVALFVSFWKGRIAMHHNRLSSTPILVIDSFIDGPRKRLDVRLINKGPGVAKISSVHCAFSGRDLFGLSLSGWNDLVRKKVKATIADVLYEKGSKSAFDGAGEVRLYCYFPWSGDAVYPGEKIELLQLLFEGDYSAYEKQVIEICREILDAMSVKVNYESIYGEKFSSRMRRREEPGRL